MTDSLIDSALRLGDIRSIVVVKPSSLGDIVHTLPAVDAIRRTLPNAHISWIANTEWIPLLAGSPVVDQVIAFPRRERLYGRRAVTAFPEWLREMRNALGGKVDLALDFQGLLRSGIISRGTRAKVILGLTDSREGARFFHHHRVEVPENCHAVDRYRAIPQALGIELPGDVAFPLPQGETIDRLNPTVPARYVVLHPYSRGEGKALSMKKSAELASALAPLPVVLLGVSDDHRRDSQSSLPENMIDLTNQTTIPQLITLMRGAKFTVSVDSGPMHIAAAISDQVLGLFSWSDPRLVGPYPPTSWVWKNGKIMQRTEYVQAPPVSGSVGSLISMEDIDIEQVAEFLSQRIGD